MNLKTWAEENGKTLEEAKEITGLTHWNQTVPESCDEIPEEPEEVIEEAVVETKSKQEGELTPEQEFSILILGNKSPYWNK